MKPRYHPVDNFTVVYTPHWQENVAARWQLLPPTPMGSELFRRMWAVGIENECCGFIFGQGFVYYKPKWNKQRERWELELISFTPAVRFHTHNRNFAVEVCP